MIKNGIVISNDIEIIGKIKMRLLLGSGATLAAQFIEPCLIGAEKVDRGDMRPYLQWIGRF